MCIRDSQTVVRRFQSLGLLCREEDEGRVYPNSGQAASVLSLLMEQLESLGLSLIHIYRRPDSGNQEKRRPGHRRGHHQLPYVGIGGHERGQNLRERRLDGYFHLSRL